MVELQSCATLVNASALCAIGQEAKGDSVNVVAEISAELERERRKNAELMERITMLEAQIRENHQHAVAKSFNKFKRQKMELVAAQGENRNAVKSEMVSHYKPDTESMVPKEINQAKHLINWMSMDNNSESFCLEKFKDCESVADFNESESDDECDDNYDDDVDNSQGHEEIDGIIETVNAQKGMVKQEDHENQHTSWIFEKSKSKKDKGKEIKETRGYIAPPDEVPSSAASERISQNRKPPKVAFCPKEVKRIIESEALAQKNAQSHTIRKIIVFASLGIRHGCEDMYELDFNHFSILRKGEPYVSPKNPGEHVLYENPGVRRKIFYPNQQNPVLCPVQILEEERSMRPSDSSCPSCLFLCIKYGGRTRNLPQNEYVRQRMGRNKLKSFGPLMCRMAMLVHIRSGSFFFKALGITLLFMAGFPDDQVQRETKYRNLDLLQKYYRTDEDAEGEELFLPHPIACDNGTHDHEQPQNSTKKKLAAKSKGKKKHTNTNRKSHNPQQSTPASSSPPTQFDLTGYSPAHHTYAMAAFQSMPSQITQDTCHIMPNPIIATPTSTKVSAGNNHSSYHHMLPPQPQPQPQLASSFVPLMYWPPPPPNAFLHGGPYPSTYGYQSFPCAANYMSFHAQTQPYYNNNPTTCSSSRTKLLEEGSGKNDLLASDETDSDSDDSSSGGTEQKQ